MNGELRVLVHRLIIALDILYDACKHETAIWHVISDLVEQLESIQPTFQDLSCRRPIATSHIVHCHGRNGS